MIEEILHEREDPGQEMAQLIEEECHRVRYRCGIRSRHVMSDMFDELGIHSIHIPVGRKCSQGTDLGLEHRYSNVNILSYMELHVQVRYRGRVGDYKSSVVQCKCGQDQEIENG